MPLIRTMFFVALCGTAIGLASSLVRAEDPVAASSGDAGSGPLIVELFTSQGCSSCPPADRLLSALGEEVEVLPLSFHVDYWNYIGWTDPFSSSRWSARQREYARELEGGRVYTPQMVIDGRASCVGSNEKTVRQLIAEARARPRHGRLELEVTPSADRRRLDLRAAGETRGDRALALYVAVVETDLETPVETGENARRTLRNDHVVRHLESAGTAGPEIETRLEIPIDPAWKVENLGVVAFLQDPRSLEIHGAASWRAGS